MYLGSNNEKSDTILHNINPRIFDPYRPWCPIGFVILGFYNVRHGSEGEKRRKKIMMVILGFERDEDNVSFY